MKRSIVNLERIHPYTVLKISVTTAGFLFVVKLMTALLTQSMAIMASALDSFMDTGSSSVNLLALKKASKPPDEDHAYGHGKIESLAGLFQSQIITVSGLYLVFESIKRLVSGTELKAVPIGIGIMVFSTVMSVFLSWIISGAEKKTKSLVLAAEHLHYHSDVLTNLGVAVALFLVYWTNLAAWDLIVSLIVALYIFKSAYKVLRRSVDELLDRNLPQSAIDEIEKMIRGHHPAIVGIHNFRSRQAGGKIFLDFHIEIRGEDDFKKAHSMTESLVDKIKKSYKHADVTIHYDPEGEN